jgi:hypothetical protein
MTQGGTRRPDDRSGQEEGREEERDINLKGKLQ